MAGVGNPGLLSTRLLMAQRLLGAAFLHFSPQYIDVYTEPGPHLNASAWDNVGGRLANLESYRGCMYSLAEFGFAHFLNNVRGKACWASAP